MGCPHGHGPPSGCSMCSAATVKVKTVTRDADGTMRVDGVALERRFQPVSTYRNGPPKRRGRPRKDQTRTLDGAGDDVPVDELE